MAASSTEGDDIFTVVSRPGPVEMQILDALSPTMIARRRVACGVNLRTLETTSPHHGHAVVLLHGRGHASTIWAPIAAKLAERRTVLAADLPGFGHSASPPFLSSHDGMAGLSFFSRPIGEWLVGRGDASIVLVGHSLGGLVALQLALERRLPVAALVLVDAMGLSPTVTLKSRLYLRTGPERIASVRSLLGIDRALRPRAGDLEASLLPLRHELLTTRGGRPQASRAFNAMLPLTGDAFHLRDRLGDVDVPVLLVWGERDDAFLLPVAIDAQTRMPRAELVTLDAGHSPHIEMPARTCSAIDAFLSRIDATR